MPYRHSPLIFALALSLIGLARPHSLAAQAGSPAAIRVQPTTLTLTVGDTARVTLQALDAAGQLLPALPVRLAGPGRALSISASGENGVWIVVALQTGEFELNATVSASADVGAGGRGAGGGGVAPGAIVVPIPTVVTWPAVETVQLYAPADLRLYEGTSLRYSAAAVHGDGSMRPDASLVWRSSDPSVVAVDRLGRAVGVSAGQATITAGIEGVSGELSIEVSALNLDSFSLQGGPEAGEPADGMPTIRTGDVARYRAVARTTDGQLLEDVPILWSYSYIPPPDIIAPSATAQVGEGIFVADVAGFYTVIASAGSMRAEGTVEVVARDVVRPIELIGQGREDRIRTTDFWVYEGLDGRDYALTGSKLSGGYTFAWDVTDPSNIFKTDSVIVDARTINDVKVSPDGRYATITREASSNRRDYAVVLDLADPAHPVVAGELSDGITGGVHNAFPTDDYAYVISNGDKYVIFDMSDIHNPRKVGEYDHPDSRLHDVWVNDGIAFSAEWENGLVAVDVGNGKWGGSPENPVLISTLPIPGGRTHAAFPYLSQSTGKFYVFVGDEIMSRNGLAWAGPQCAGSYTLPYDPLTGENGCPLVTRGYVQVIDFTDPENPEMVARYEMPEYGTHNIWVEDDLLYQAYYEGGLRVVDVSGELRGNLYTQGREVAVYKPTDPAGYVPNSTMVWSAMPHKGWVFFSDTNSGLWAVRIRALGRPIS